MKRNIVLQRGSSLVNKNIRLRFWVAKEHLIPYQNTRLYQSLQTHLVGIYPITKLRSQIASFSESK